MKYTLDSIKQVQTSLEVKFKSSRITYEQVILSGLEMDMTANPRKAYFGVLTVHPDCKAILFNGENEIITADGGSQIIEFFTHAEFRDSGNLLVDPKGQFRGSLIQILD